MGNWNRHFVRIGNDGNVQIYGSDNTSEIEIYKSDTYPQININGTGQISGIIRGSMVNAYSTSLINPSDSPQGISLPYPIVSFLGQSNAMNGISFMAGSPDLRLGVTAADASPITIFSSTVSGVRYEVKARILATAGTSATYTITWTEGGAARTVALTVTAAGTEYHDNFVIAPDAGTNITAQITSLTSSTVNVDAIVSVLG